MSNLKVELIKLDLNSSEHLDKLDSFCRVCALERIVNNSSMANLKLDQFRARSLAYWAAIDRSDDRIVGLAGCHSIPEVGAEFFRVLFRGAMLRAYRGIGREGLGKDHRNSFLFRYATPQQILWGRQNGFSRFVITTNIQNSQLSPTDRLFHILEKQGIVNKIGSNVNLFSCMQNIWEIDPEFFDL